jgi:hypothetical protein
MQSGVSTARGGIGVSICSKQRCSHFFLAAMYCIQPSQNELMRGCDTGNTQALNQDVQFALAGALVFTEQGLSWNT